MTLILTVETCGNPDMGERAAPSHAPGFSESVADMGDASRKLRAYVEHNGLGGGNLKRADLIEGNMIVARVSYNGKVWPAGEWRRDMVPLFNPYG